MLSSNDTGIIIDPGVGSGLALTREMLQGAARRRREFFEQMRAAAAELGRGLRRRRRFRGRPEHHHGR
ncbi:MAG: hypothetical protein ACLUNO_10010 [Oscillospiraceae bacterium]